MKRGKFVAVESRREARKVGAVLLAEKTGQVQDGDIIESGLMSNSPS